MAVFGGLNLLRFCKLALCSLLVLFIVLQLKKKKNREDNATRKPVKGIDSLRAPASP